MRPALMARVRIVFVECLVVSFNPELLESLNQTSESEKGCVY